VSIVVALKCRDAIVLASDSQTTRRHLQAFRTRRNCILSGLPTAPPVVGESGSAVHGNRAIQLLQYQGQRRSYWRGRYRGRNRQTGFAVNFTTTKEASHPHHSLEIGTGNCGMTGARNCSPPIYYEGRPYLYTTALHDCIPVKIGSAHAAIGIGATVADYVLKPFPVAAF